MKHWVLKEHTDCCNRDTERYRKGNNPYQKVFADFCDRNNEHILFYHNGDFYLLSLKKCWVQMDRYSSISDILKQIGLKIKVKNKFSRDYNLDGRFKRARAEGVMMENEFIEVNYIYTGVGKFHTMTSVISLVDAIESQKEYRQNYEKAQKYLVDSGFDFLVNQLDMLYNNNWILIPNEREIIKSIDNIILNINGNN